MKTSKRIYTALTASLLCSAASASPILWVGDGDGTLGTVDVATGAATVIGQMRTTMTDIAFDTSGNLWGITFNQLYRIDQTNAAISLVGNLGTTLNSLVFGSDGTLYAANNGLYTINTSTGAASLIGGGGGYSSSGDLAFVNGNLYLSSVGDTLYSLNTTTGAGTLIGSIGSAGVYGLATDNNVDLYGVRGTSVIGINTTTGAGSLLTNYGGTALGEAWGSAFRTEASGVPEPMTMALCAIGLAGLGAARRRQ